MREREREREPLHSKREKQGQEREVWQRECMQKEREGSTEQHSQREVEKDRGGGS